MSNLYRMVVAYDGTEYSGWQVQPNGITIQEILQDTLSRISQHPVMITGSGRTDAGVHALGQVAHFTLEKELDPSKLIHSLNSLLPKDIRIRILEIAPSGFHSRYSARSKIYHYHLTTGFPDPFRRRYSTHFPYPLNMDDVKAAAKCFVGTHDFTSFANEASAGSASRDAVREIYRLDVIDEEHGYRFEFEGEGFLYKMVRNIMGTLLEVGSGKLAVSDIPALFEAKDRRKAGRTAPPQGLFLIRVDYEGWPQTMDSGMLLP
jgi:tRNA pseudouridine38-40 synthase